MATTRARKQRKRLFNAPLHQRTRLMAVHLAKDLRKGTELPRSVPVRKGDTVKVMRGDFAGTTGKVAEVDRRAFRVTVEGIRQKKADDKEVARAIHPSNLLLTAFDESDPIRRGRLAALAKGERNR
jgi:large subunit ribosomal protein L24